MQNIEILSPVGDWERLEAAILYGADAVYLGGSDYGMRASAAKFDRELLKKAVDFAHEKGVKVYLTCNTLPRNDEVKDFPEYIKFVESTGVDACIVADIGVLAMCKKYAPNLEIHISTQAGIVNYETARAFYDMGAKRVVLARELSLEEIKGIRDNIPSDMDIEVFVHGAMCMSFSGRCLISNYMINRDANRGECAQPCRWGYHLVEEKRPNEYYPIYEDEKGSYILNAKDLCMIEHVDKLVKAGVTSFKIEGRAKSAYYVSVVTNAYKLALEEYKKNPSEYITPEWLVEEVSKVSHRRYTTGFYFDTPTQYYENGGYLREFDVIAVIDECKDGKIYCTQKNKFYLEDDTEILSPGGKPIQFKIKNLFDKDGNSIEDTKHANMKFYMESDEVFVKGSMIRKAR